ncbi:MULTISPECIES: hypothetical protein [unclassified Bradyrhizobium]|uniref:hypothetical protein n=1 Tax=unclassified Bradyrhizobium TaxID=2631580 RepID=UPI0013E199A1|nr:MULTISPECIES: hypothetical protein [unclassified Bradyrhizobium]QIG91040.1 hypothetical protein G6P99_31010 [Bradyrhizobium sp. 6(2017)]
MNGVKRAAAREQAKASRQRYAARVSSDVADVAKRPKKRPGSRERSSITTRWQGWLA